MAGRAPPPPPWRAFIGLGSNLGDRVMGVLAGYLVWSERIGNQPQAIALVEHVVGHAMGEPGRELLSELEGMPSRGRLQ